MVNVLLYTFLVRRGCKPENEDQPAVNGRGYSESYCRGIDKCNNQYNVTNKRTPIKCHGNNQTVEGCDLCKWSSNPERIGCGDKSGKKALTTLGKDDAVDGNWFTCHGDFCNTDDHSKWRKCYVGQYGDCEWTFEHVESYEVSEETCDQWYAQNICVQQLWTHKTNTTRVCHKFRCHHQFINHGYELVRKPFPNLTAVCHDTSGDVQVCDIFGNASNDLPVDKKCWTGIEGDCKFYINKEIGQAFFHEPKETFCTGWDGGCYKAVFNGTCTWYDCARFHNKITFVQEHAEYNYTRKGTTIEWPVDHYRCVGENCNTPKDSANDLGSNLALMLLVIGLLNVFK
uniref:Uncharacterized protein n=1 Tax=Panagrolaimus sp. JU765 TaxID=591449 RepID=A0AC34QB94_9BILA